MKKAIAILLGTVALANTAFASSKAELHITAIVVKKCEFINGKAICGNDLIKQAQQSQTSAPTFFQEEETKESEVHFNENTITLEDNNSETIVKSYEF